jgi:hypothetical protein
MGLHPGWPDGWIEAISPEKIEIDKAYTGPAALGVGGPGVGRGIMSAPITTLAITAELWATLSGPQPGSSSQGGVH